ncbi:hypothetical protein [Bradyrhizobium sp. 141]|uniref:hypothetical protein n=1 Tax=Bradyrhizobium sp. 141 TaxID=2782617 RepID=UPI001FFB7344|nr:hypothetical protein [Bradyrhizobium sp. 141]MCK1717203.1 hypothetical protein [Bradyrhizobium sp. 141]
MTGTDQSSSAATTAPLDETRFEAAMEAYWAATGGTEGGLRAAIAAYIVGLAQAVPNLSATTISYSYRTVTIECGSLEHRDDIYDWLMEHAAQPPAAPVEPECSYCHGKHTREECKNLPAQSCSAGTTDAGCGAAVITPWAVEGSSRDWFGDLNERIGKGLNAPLEPSADNGDQRTEDGGSLVDRLRGRAAYLRNIGEVKSPELMEKAANALKPSARCACVDPYENCEFPDCPQGEDHAETPARAATPDGVENLRAILNDQPYLNSALSVHEIKVILANEGGFMPDEAVLWFRTARGNMGSPLSSQTCATTPSNGADHG